MNGRESNIFGFLIFFLVIMALVCPASGSDEDILINTSVIPVAPVLRGEHFSFDEILPQHTAPIAYVWVFGKKYLEINNVTFNNSRIGFSWNTTDMPAGRYYLLVQVPGPEDIFDITYDDKSGIIRNEKKSEGAGRIFSLAEARNMYGRDPLNVILREFESPGVDDQVIIYSIDIVEPAIIINPIGDHSVGETIEISGTTNLPANTTLMISAGPKTFTNYPPNYFDGQVEVVQGDDGNHWSVLLNTSLFRVDRYSLMVYPVKNTFPSRETAFNMTPQQSVSPTPIISQSGIERNIFVSQQMPTDTAVINQPNPTTRTPLPVGLSIGALGILLVITRTFNRKRE